MSRRDFEVIWEYLDKLRRLSEVGGISIVVEGEEDRKSLRGLGISGTVKTVRELKRAMRSLSGGGLRGAEFVLMVDFDSEGRRILKRLSSEIEALGGSVIRWPREEYLRLNLPSRVEELLPYLERRGYPWMGENCWRTS